MGCTTIVEARITFFDVPVVVVDWRKSAFMNKSLRLTASFILRDPDSLSLMLFNYLITMAIVPTCTASLPCDIDFLKVHKQHGQNVRTLKAMVSTEQIRTWN